MLAQDALIAAGSICSQIVCACSNVVFGFNNVHVFIAAGSVCSQTVRACSNVVFGFNQVYVFIAAGSICSQIVYACSNVVFRFNHVYVFIAAGSICSQIVCACSNVVVRLNHLYDTSHAEANFIAGGKRPLSSMSPTIVLQVKRNTCGYNWPELNVCTLCMPPELYEPYNCATGKEKHVWLQLARTECVYSVCTSCLYSVYTNCS